MEETTACHWCASDKGGGRGRGPMGREQRGKGGWGGGGTAPGRAKPREEELPASWTEEAGPE